MKITTEPLGFSADVRSTLPSYLDRLAPRSTPLRRAFVLVLLVLSFALALGVMDRARREVITQTPAAQESPTPHVDALLP